MERILKSQEKKDFKTAVQKRGKFKKQFKILKFASNHKMQIKTTVRHDLVLNHIDIS